MELHAYKDMAMLQSNLEDFQGTKKGHAQAQLFSTLMCT